MGQFHLVLPEAPLPPLRPSSLSAVRTQQQTPIEGFCPGPSYACGYCFCSLHPPGGPGSPPFRRPRREGISRSTPVSRVGAPSSRVGAVCRLPQQDQAHAFYSIENCVWGSGGLPTF